MRLTADFQSTMLTRASYDPDTQTLDITFTKGASYTYEGVPEDIFFGLRDADSPGRYYHANIKDRF